MQALRPYWHYLTGCRPHLILLQLLIIVRPVIGGFGFMLIVPMLNIMTGPIPASNEKLSHLLSLLPKFDDLVPVLGLFFLIMLVIAVLNYTQNIIAEIVEQHLLVRIRKDLYRLLMTTQWQHIIKTHQADYTRILAEEIGSVTSILDQTLSLMSLAALTIIYTAICFYLSPGLTLIAIMLGFVLLLTTHPIQSLISHLGTKHLVATEKMFRLASDQIKGLKVIKSSGTERRHNLHYAETVESLATEELSYHRLTSLTQFIHSIISALAFCVLAYIAYEMMNADIATLVILALIFSRLMPQISRLRTYLQRIAYLEPGLRSVSALLHHLRSHQEVDGVETTFDLSSGLHLVNVCYQYPDGDEMVLDNINGSLSTNQLIALTGDSGIGKSTLADIIAGISLPTSGEIRIGDTILDESNQRSWRRYVTYLPQVPFLIESSVRENLNLLLPTDATDDQLNRAIDLAAANFLHQLPQGLATVIGDNGVTLSGGERQRLQLARGLLEDRPVMILDETTGNLDLGTEDSIVATLNTLKARRLIIMISHRPSISEFADQVFTVT